MPFVDGLAPAIAATSIEPGRRRIMAEAVGHLVPTGRLRVAITIEASLSASGVIRLPGGGLRGVPVELATALAARLGVPLDLVPYGRADEIRRAAGSWDVTFMTVDDDRRGLVAFGAAYHVGESGYLVPAGSPIRRVEDADAAWVRIAGVRDTAPLRASGRTAPRACHLALETPDDAITLMRNGGADAIVLGREGLGAAVWRIEGSRILDGAFPDSITAVAVPSDRARGLALVNTFIEDAKATGLVRQSFTTAGLGHAAVAPTGLTG